ncbi:hypothetical protein QYM36_011426 [Artemia franciscana]|uniref:Uncharacterized protein n=1 Tax=Artemia franciscana TaxID=6661 RepID=A0AA88HLZ5_ARTSF|nr:hypothetical protein QYM36_011426 [Artemia franciscana]
MSKLDPPDPYLEGSHAKPKSNIAISPPQITKPANNDNDKTEKARTRQPSRPSTSSDGTIISVGSPQWCEPNCQVPDDENHLAWDDFQVVQKLKKKNNKKRKVDGPNLSVPTDESTAPTPNYELSIPMFAVVISLVQKNTSLKPLKFEPKKHIDFLRMNIFKKLRKEFDIFINRNGEAEVFANDAACLTSLLDLTHIGNMEVTCPAAAVDQVSISRVTDLQSDHCAIKTTISNLSHQTKPGKMKFINKKGNWPMFKQIMQEANYNLLEDFSQIDDKIKILNKIMMDAAHKAIPKTSPNIWTPTANKRIKNWWNELCSTAVEAKNVAKKAF